MVEWVKRSTLRWYGHVMRMNECDFAKRVYESTIEGGGRQGSISKGVIEGNEHGVRGDGRGEGRGEEMHK